jgi:hypothetical protein
MDREERDMRGNAKAGTAKLGLALVGAVVAMLLFASPASAKKTHLFLETFGSAAQPKFEGAGGLGIDRSNGDLLVIDFKAKTLSRFKPNGEPDPFSALGTNVIDAKKGPAGKACAEEPVSCDQTPQNGLDLGNGFEGEAQVAVDNSGTVTDGDIYLTEFKSFVDVFASDGHYLGQLTAAGGSSFEHICGVAVDPGGNLFLAELGKFGVEEPEGKIFKLDPSANPPLSTDNAATFTTPEVVCDLAAGAGPSAGALFANTFIFTTGHGNSVYKLNAASGALEATFDPGEDKVIAVDPASGHLFTPRQEFAPAGTLVSTFGGGNGVTIDGNAERIYLSSGSAVAVYDSALVSLPDVSTRSYEIKGDTSVRVKGTVNPDGEALTECFFEYDTTKYNSFEGPHTHGLSAPCEAPSAAEVGSGSGPVAVHADLTGLAGETAYHFRLVANNPNAALYTNDKTTTIMGADQAFKTPSKPGINGLWAANVITTDATLKATVNPENSPTTYRFEWGLDSSYGNSSAEFSLGSGQVDHTVGFNLTGLEPSTTYHYRLVATNGIGITEATDHYFTTFAAPIPPGAECENDASRTGFGTLLPDCRAYEMVSPVDKEGGDIRVLKTSLGGLAVLEQSSDSGEKLAYGSLRSFGDAASGAFTSQYIAQRIEGAEWATHPINPPRGRSLVGAAGEADTEFKAFSADLCEGWFANFADPPLAEGALAGYRNLYRRSDRLCGEEGYEALAPIETPVGVLSGSEFSPLVEGVSADDAHAIFTANGKLAPEGSDKGERQLYESADEAPPWLVCVLPDGMALSGSCAGGSNIPPAEPAGLDATPISADGKRIFWSTPAVGEGKLYVRENPDQPESARLHGAGAGTGNLIGPAVGSGNVAGGSELAKSVKSESGEFAVGQKISDSAGKIPANTTIKAIEETSPGIFTFTLSAKATGLSLGDAFTGAASEKVSGILTETGAFETGQEITAPGIPPGTTVLACLPSCGPTATLLTLSAKAIKTEPGAALSATSPCTEAQTKACTVAVSKAAEEEAGTSNSWFWGAAQDGSRAIFSTGDFGLAGGAFNGEAKAKLYSFEPDSEATHLIAEDVQGVMGISEDANRVYFASKEEIPGSGENSEHQKAKAGEPNLYLYEAGVGGGSTSFVATLASGDLVSAVSNERYGKRNSRVSPDGLHAAFESVAPLSQYDNTGAQSGESTSEIYLYDANTNKLACVSCNPSGERPAGPSSIPAFETGMHAARVLTDDGTRLYFDSADALTPRDTNGAVDVYQWEAPGAGTCTEASSDYSLQDEGCIDLISSGQSHIDSRFVESDPTGDNVFLATASSLLPQDPGGVDIYDARVGGGLPIPEPPAPGCEGEACQSASEAPNDPTPASASFEGAGNVREAPVPLAPCAKGKVRRHGKCVAKKHRKRAKRHRRAAR